MNKAEVMSIGVPQERVKEFQHIFHTEVRKEAQKRIERYPSPMIQDAILTMIQLINAPDKLSDILIYISGIYADSCNEKALGGSE